MSICVALNLSDGVVIAVDSATTLTNSEGTIMKVFPDVDKLFQLGNLKVGIATYGVAALKGRTIGSFIREFAAQAENADLIHLSLLDIVERLRIFFYLQYIAAFEERYQQPFLEIADELKGVLGLVVAGFSAGAYQSEVWEIVVPRDSAADSSRKVNDVGEYGLAWFASAIPINRYLQGIDPYLRYRLGEAFVEILGRPMTDDEVEKLRGVLDEARYSIQVAGMPIQGGIDCAKFLVDYVLGHYRICETHPIVGGKARVGTVTYSANAFQILP